MITTRCEYWEVLSPPSVYFSKEFPYIFVAKASFSAYVLLKKILKTAEKVHFLASKSTTNFGRVFCSFPFPCFASKWLKYAVFFAFQKAKKGRQKTTWPYLYIVSLVVILCNWVCDNWVYRFPRNPLSATHQDAGMVCGGVTILEDRNLLK